VAYEYQHGELDRRIIQVQPYQLVGGGCQPELIGLGPVHVWAPHLHMGLPLPPCPKHGWASYDQGKNKVHREMSLMPELISILVDKGLIQQPIA
jgi:hypothetical protein